MPVHIRALIVILFFSIIGFTIAKKIFRNQVDESEFKIWRNSWIFFTLIAFLSSNFWLYITLGSLYIFYIFKKTNNKLALFFVLLIVIPPMGKEIPGFGLINYLINLNQPRFLSLFILLPLAISIPRKNKLSFPKISTDFFILFYILLSALIQFRDTTFTDSLRGSFYLLTDIFLPYYVASRYIKNLEQMKAVAVAILSISIVISLIGIFEHFKGWLLYRSLYPLLDFSHNDFMLMRSGGTRSEVTFGQTIVFGYFMSIALGFYLFASQNIQKKNIKRLGFVIILLGLYAPVSRGPWVGAVVMILVFILLGQSALKKLAVTAFIAVLLIPTLTIVPGGDKYLNLIPFIGETEKENVMYRQNLYYKASAVIDRNFLLGSANYINEPEIQSLKVGGVIDIVNSYIQITLKSGYVGLFLFAGSFVTVLIATYNQILRIKDKNDELRTLLRTLLGIMLAIAVTIATVSFIGTVPVFYWSTIGFCAGLSFIARKIDKKM